MKFNRIITIVLDSVGIGAAHDAEAYNDLNTDTLGNIATVTGGIYLPILEQLGIGYLHTVKGVKANEKHTAYLQRLQEASVGKDTMTGHWEMMGLYIDKPFNTFTEHGFPQELLDELSSRTGYGIIGNVAASGTEIIHELGEEHIRTKDMIVYTSADSVLQIAAHEEHFGLDELYRVCEIAREITMKDEWKVGRIIARPFIGENKDNFVRTANRHDYALKPYNKTVLDHLKEDKFDVISVGKIADIFDNEGITVSYRTKRNFDGMEKTIDLVKHEEFKGLLFTNLVDFDALWGHRRNPVGYKDQLEEFDVQLKELLKHIRHDDLLILTADHGNDPTHVGTDHTREEVFAIYYSPQFNNPKVLNKGLTFADIGATIAENFKIQAPNYGKSVLDQLK